MYAGRTVLKKRIREMAKAALALSMCLIMPFTAIPASAAQNEMPDITRTGSLSITFTYYDENIKKTYPVTGGNAVGLYKVADAVVDNGFVFVKDSRFASAGEIPSTDEELDAANLDLAKEMAEIAKRYSFDVKPKEMDADGTVTFEDLGVGLYLVMQSAQGEENYKFSISPFLITIPYRNPDGTLSYDVDAQSKPLKVVREKTPPTPTPTGIPQTGQLWWPAMAFGAAGALLVMIGVVLRQKNRL